VRAEPLVVGVVAVAWLGILRRFVLAHSSPVEDPARSRRLVARVTWAAQALLALVLGASAAARPGLVAAAAGAGLLLVSAAVVSTYAGSRPAPTAGVPAPTEGWLFVPRGNGTGLRIAPNHPHRWRALALLLAGPVALALAALLG
jgi:hypothetical protein